MSYKQNINVRLPKKTTGRHTIYIDESGTASLKDKGRYFVLTGVIATNHSFNNVEEFYFNLKRKYFGYIQHLHSVELFSANTRYLRKSKAQLFKIKKYRRKYIQELAYFLDTVPFVFLTVIVDKRRMLKSLHPVQINHLWATTIGEAKRIYTSMKNCDIPFTEARISDVIKTIDKFKILPIDHFRPLKVAYKKLLLQYFKNYKKNIYTAESKMQICVESSEYQSRILKYTEEFLLETDHLQHKPKKTRFSKELKTSLYNMSFPNKKAKFLGLEIADIISYGHYLASHHKRSKNELYKDIWIVIEKRKKDIEKKYNIKCVVKI